MSHNIINQLVFMKKIFYFFTLCFLLSFYSNSIYSQYYYYDDKYYDKPLLFEIGASVGAMNSLTDIGGNKGIGKKFIKDLNLGNTKFCGGVFINAIYKDIFAIRLEGNYGKVEAYDNVLSKVSPTDIAVNRYNRNLSFRSIISEVSVIAEIYPLEILNNLKNQESDPAAISPYLLGGIGHYTFNPQTNLNGNWIDLQPLRTEGQGFNEYPERKVYKLSQVNYPVGAGLKYALNDLINIRGEFIYRILTTDYLDDVSTTYIDPSLYSTYFTGDKLTNALLLNDRQINKVASAGGKRGNPQQKDAYFSFNIKISYTLGREKVK